MVLSTIGPMAQWATTFFIHLAAANVVVQILRWMGPTATSSTDLNDHVEGSSSTHQPANDKPVLSLVLQHPSQEPAAMAVLAALYGVSEAHELSQEQLLQAAVLADMWQLPDVATAAVELLVDAAKGPGLSEVASKAFLDLEVIPNCLLPLYSAIIQTVSLGGTANLASTAGFDAGIA